MAIIKNYNSDISSEVFFVKFIVDGVEDVNYSTALAGRISRTIKGHFGAALFLQNAVYSHQGTITTISSTFKTRSGIEFKSIKLKNEYIKKIIKNVH